MVARVTSTLGRPAPPRPARFSADGAPAGVEVDLLSFWQTRPKLRDPLRSAFVHTNGATGEGSIESAKRWAEAKPNSNTAPHYQVDRSGRAAKFLPSDRRAIANATVDAFQGSFGDVAWWSLAIETADPGYPVPGEAAGFTEAQGEAVATILAYEASVWPSLGASLVKLPAWHGAGIAGHTDPFGYPYTTLHRGKVCPGATKKAELWSWILPRTLEIFAAWHYTPARPDVPTYPPLPPGGPAMALTELLDYPADDVYGDAVLRKDGNTLAWIGSGHVSSMERTLPAGSYIVRDMATEAASRGVPADVLTHAIIRTCATSSVPPPFIHRNGGLRQSWQLAGTTEAARSGDPSRPVDGTGAGTF